MRNSLTERENFENPASANPGRRDRILENSFDLALVLLLPLYASYEFIALGKPTLPVLVGLETLLLLWLARRRNELRSGGLGLKLAAIASLVLALLFFAGFSLPAIYGAPPEFTRYELSITLGRLTAGIPTPSLGVGVLSLGLAHLGGTRLGLLFGSSALERRRLHDIYFAFTALLANLALVRYAGGPFFA